MQSNVTLKNPCQFRYLMCSSSSTPGATIKPLIVVASGVIGKTPVLQICAFVRDSFQGVE